VLGEEPLQVGLDPVLDQTGVDPEVEGQDGAGGGTDGGGGDESAEDGAGNGADEGGGDESADDGGG